MNYNEFITYIKNSFKRLMGGNSRIEVKSIIKNNDCEMEALIIMEGDCVVSPTIYLNDYYEAYKKGMHIGDIISQIYRTYKNYKIDNNISAEFFRDFAKIKSNIVYKHVNKDNNKKLLKDVPYFEYLDLAIVFYFIINTEDIKNATALIHNRHLELWNINKDALFEIAKYNTPRLLRCTMADMNDVIRGFIYEEMTDGKGVMPESLAELERLETAYDNRTVKMFVLTNNLKVNGAACILYDNIIRQFASFIGSDLYIIPSSVHEVILVPAGSVGIEELNKMVRQVNREEVEKYEILSDHIYKYVYKQDKIIIP